MRGAKVNSWTERPFKLLHVPRVIARSRWSTTKELPTKVVPYHKRRGRGDVTLADIAIVNDHFLISRLCPAADALASYQFPVMILLPSGGLL